MRNDLFSIPFGSVLWTADELVEWNEEGHDPFNAPELMPKFSSQLGHSTWRAFSLLHELLQQLHRLLKFFLSDENATSECIKNYSDVEVALFD